MRLVATPTDGDSTAALDSCSTANSTWTLMANLHRRWHRLRPLPLPPSLSPLDGSAITAADSLSALTQFPSGPVDLRTSKGSARLLTL